MSIAITKRNRANKAQLKTKPVSKKASRFSHPVERGKLNEAISLLLGELEEMVLISVIKLQPNAYGVAVENLIDQATSHTRNLSGLYSIIKRLTEKGFIVEAAKSGKSGEAGPPRKYFEITSLGMQALEATAFERDQREAHRFKLGVSVKGLRPAVT
jgi:PadR family transcriptional regulator, regulatory protein PadR